VLIGMADMLAASVVERTREIGSLRALGLRPRVVRRMILLEATLVGCLGLTVAGMAGGSLGALWVRATFPDLLGWLLGLHLPWRQVVAGAETLAPAEFGLKRQWSPADYDGSTVDNTRVINVAGQALTPPWTRVMPEERLKQESAAVMARKNLNFLPKSLARYEYAVPDRYVPGILDLARQAGTPVLLLYLPGYGRPAAPYDMRLYDGARMVAINDILTRTDIWHDIDHLNAKGAALASARLAELLAPMLRHGEAGTGAPNARTCDWGFGARPTLRPFRAQKAS